MTKPHDPHHPQGHGAAVTDVVAADAHGQLAGLPVSHTQRESDHEHEARLIQGRMWLVSFTDLFSIILCFFILMYSMKEPDFEKIAKVVGISDGSGYAGIGAGESSGTHAGAGIDRVEYGEALDLSYLEGVLRRTLQQANVEDDVKVTTGRNHLKLTIDDADGDRGAIVAKSLGERLTLLPNRIAVVGIPARWSSGDWLGALERAQSFATHMKDGGYRKRLTILGEGQGSGPSVEIRVEADDGRIQ